jgi:hypothetical protein
MSEHDRRPERIDVHLHIAGLAEILGPLLGIAGRVLQNTERLIQMSQSLSQQIDAATAAIQADVAAVSAEVSALLAGVKPGSTITQAQVDALTAIDTSLKAIPAAP